MPRTERSVLYKRKHRIVIVLRKMIFILPLVPLFSLWSCKTIKHYVMANKSQAKYMPLAEAYNHPAESHGATWFPNTCHNLLWYQFRNLNPIDKATKSRFTLLFSRNREEREKLWLVSEEPFTKVLVELVKTWSKRGIHEGNAGSGRQQNPPIDIKYRK